MMIVVTNVSIVAIETVFDHATLVAASTDCVTFCVSSYNKTLVGIRSYIDAGTSLQ